MKCQEDCCNKFRYSLFSYDSVKRC